MNENCEKLTKEDFQMDSASKGSFQMGEKTIFYYKVTKGENREKILLTHGFGAFCALYIPLINALGEYYDVLCIDLPGHGFSSPAEDYPPSLFLDTLVEGCKVNQYETFYIVGNSMGGQIAAWCASYEGFKRFQIKGIFISAPSGVAMRESFGQKLMKRGFFNLVPQKTLFNMIRQGSVKQLKQAKGQYKLNMQLEHEIFDSVINDTYKRCAFADRTMKQVKHFPWSKSQEQFILLDKSNIPVQITLLTNDKIINTPKLTEFLKKECKRIKLEFLDDDHSFNSLKPKYYAQLVHAYFQQLQQ